MRTETILYICLMWLAAVFMPGTAHSTPEYSESTGLECSACHTNPLGGGELTSFGESYMQEVSASKGYRPPDGSKRFVRLLIGYLHILAGVVWFGAIFYVHIILKPAYAAKGLPRSELMLGWTCIAIVGTTGALLTIARMGSLSSFYDTRFGILLSVKILLFLVMAGTAAVVTFVIGPRLKAKRAAAEKEGGVYTLAELQGFDGADGRKAYVAVDGVVYDVSASRLWKDGRHMRHLAGDDMTGAINSAPHGPEKLEGMPVSGRLVAQDSQPRASGPKAAFYVMAYINLAMVFLILGIVALWRWW